LVNVLFDRNWAGMNGAAVYVQEGNPLRLIHTTIVSPTVPTGAMQAVYVDYGTVYLTNTIIASHTIGIQGASAATVVEDYNLFSNVGMPFAGMVGHGTNNSMMGTAAFADHTTYQLSAASAAIDAGTNAGITTDYFGGTRPQGSGYDLGYAEFVTPLNNLVGIYKNAAGQPFTVERDGYKFRNFGNDTSRNWQDDLTAKDLFQLFGPQVCQQPNATVDNCTLTTSAEEWRIQELKGMNGGHSEGLAVTSLMFFEGKMTPVDFQTNATTVADLNFPAQPLENYVARYVALQKLKEVFEKQLMDKKPSEIVTLLTNNFKASKPLPYRLSIFNSPGYKDGHAMGVFGVEKMSETVYRIWVYDNNSPKARRYVTVDTAQETWEYFTANDPSKPAVSYKGTAATNSLWLSNVYDRQLAAGQYFACPFCATSKPANRLTALQSQAEAVEVGFTGEGAILVVDNDNRAIGYDFNQNMEVNEIPEARIIYNNGGLGKQIPPTYELPYPVSDAQAMYTVYVSNEVVTATTDGMLSIVGNGFVMGVDYLQLDANEYYEIGFSPDGDMLTIMASQSTLAPALFVTYEPITETEPSIRFELDGAMLEANEVLTVILDPLHKFVYFDDSLDIGNEFTLSLTEVYPTGETASYTHTVTLPVGSKEAYIDFGAWDGTGAAPVYIDGVLQGATNEVYLPIIRR